MNVAKQDGSFLIFECPHCTESVIVNKNEINCTIFRHAYFKQDMQQIGPHTRKEECDRLFKDGLVYGCAKPFKINKHTYEISICDYI